VTINKPFRSKLSQDIFNAKYRHDGAETWDDLCKTLVNQVCSPFMSKDEVSQLTKFMQDMKFIPGGRYLYYAGRPKPFMNNCFLLRSEEDTREDWANLSWKAESCLMTGGGIGNDYSVYRPRGTTLGSTGGVASGPIPKMLMINEIGRNVMQGGSRRSAIYASLNWQHGDIHEFLSIKDWDKQVVSGTNGLSVGDLKRANFDYKAPLDTTNISINYDTDWLLKYYTTGSVGDVFKRNVRQAMTTGEPGFSFNFFEKEKETLRNACTEVTSEDDSDVCNLGSLNLSRCSSIGEFAALAELGTKFLLCGTLIAEVPYPKVADVREKNRRLGLGLMGIHEWLLQRNSSYEVTPELHKWLNVYKGVSDHVSRSFSKELSISTPVANRAIAPTGTIGMLAGTTTGIEPVYATAYKRRYLVNGNRWRYQFAVDHMAQTMVEQYGIDPDTIESAYHMSNNYEKRIKFQADVQDYVDMSISSTINLPKFDGDETKVETMSQTLAKYAPRLRGFTCYPDGSRGGQPLTSVPYKEAIEKLGEEFDEHIEFNDVCDITGGGTCGQ